MQTTAVEQQPAPSFQAVNKPPNPTSVSSSESNDTNSANRSPGRFIPDSASEPRTPASPTTQLRLSLASSSFNTSYQTTNGEIMESPSTPTNPPVPCRPPGGNARGRAGTRRSIADGTESGDDSGGTGNRRSLSRQGSSQGRKKKKGQRFYCTGYGDCDLSFTRSEHLARHIRKHTGERPFQCHCGRTFSRLDNLRQHSSTVHADEDIPASSLAAQGTRYQRHVSKSQLAKCRGKAPEKAHPLAGEHVKTPAVQEPEQQRQQEEDDEGEDASPFDSSLARQDASRSRPRPTPIRVPQQDLGTGPAFRNYRDNNTPPDSPVSAVGPSRREAAYYSERHTPYPAPRSAIASLTTPTSATFANGHGSPLSPTPSPWAAASTAGISVVSSPVSSFPRRQSELGRTQARRLSVPGPARYTPIPNSSFALPSNLSSTPPSRNSIPPFPGPLVNPLLHRDSRRDSVNSVTDEEDEKAKRRRTWGPDSGSNYRTPLPRDVLSPMTGTFAQASISGSSTEYNGSSPSSSPSSTTSNQQNVQASSPFPPLKINQFPQNNTTLPGIRDILQDVGPDFSKRMPRPRAASSATEYSVPESSRRGSLRSPFIPSHSRSSSSGGLSSAPFYEPSERPVSSYGRRDSASRPSSALSQLNFQFPRRDTLPDSPSKGPTLSDETAAPFRGNHMRISGVHGHSRSHSYDTPPRQYAGLTSNSNIASSFNVSSPLIQKRAFLNWRTTVSSTVHWEGGSNQPRSGSNGLESRAVEMPRTSANSLPGDPIGNGEHIEKSERAIVPSRLTFMYTPEDNLDRGVQQQANSNLPAEKAPTSTNTARSDVSASADKSGLTTGANNSIPRMEEALGVLASAANLVSIQEKRRHEPYTKAVGFNYTSDNTSSQYQ